MSMPLVASSKVAASFIFPGKVLGVVSALNLTTVTPLTSETVRVGFSYFNSLFGGSDELVPTSIMASGLGGACPLRKIWTTTVVALGLSVLCMVADSTVTEDTRTYESEARAGV